MIFGLYAAGLGAIGQSVRLDLIANNLANVNTPAFRRDQLTFRERLTEALEDRPDLKYYNSLVHRYGGAPFIDGISYDKEAASYDVTGRALDFAIRGDGYFTVRERNTDRLFYTRAGNFVLDSQGNLATADGKYLVLSEEGEAMRVDAANANDLKLDAAGALHQGDVLMGRFRIVDFSDAEGVRKIGENLYQPFAAERVEAPEARVVQAALEASTVNPVVEMVDMIRTMRALESNLQMVRIQDGTLDRVVNEFGRPAR
ncbi:MAG: flagellar hook basal-body protein [Planctomycetes bacterium]|nr:flagellar hook basal-body protein [Planctomycetota bacterium]